MPTIMEDGLVNGGETKIDRPPVGVSQKTLSKILRHLRDRKRDDRAAFERAGFRWSMVISCFAEHDIRE